MKKWSLIMVLMILFSAGTVGCGRYDETSSEKDKDNPSFHEKIPGAKETKQPEPTESANPGHSEVDQEQVLFPVAKSDEAGVLYGYVNTNMEFVIEPQFKHAQPFFSSGIAIATDLNDKMGIINTKGEFIVSPEYYYFDYTDGLLLTYSSQGDDTYAFNEKGEMKFKLKGYVRPFSEGLASFSSEGKKGYIDTSGKIVMELPYEYLGDFTNEIAKVSPTYFGPSFYIDKKGNDITSKVSSGLRVVKDSTTNLYGYEDKDGNLVINYQFSEADPFLNNLAIVNSAPESFQSQYGIINIKGDFVLEPIYTGIKRMKNGSFAVGIETGPDGAVPPQFFEFSKRALYSSDLNRRTDWIYVDIDDFDSNTVCVSDGERISFLDASLDLVKDMPNVPGRGLLYKDGDFLRGTVSGKLTILNKKGDVLLVDEGLTLLGDHLSTITGYRYPTYYRQLSYPILNGLQEKATEDKVNQIIIDEMVTPWETEESVDEYYFPVIYTSYAASRIKNLLHIDQYIEEYYLGAAHGAHYRKNLYISLKDGKVFGFDDLFSSPEEARKRISKIITGKMQSGMDEMSYFEDHVNPDQIRTFSLTHESIIVYFAEYEIAPYAAGMPEFEIPFSELMDLVNTEGDFWKSFH